MRTVRWCLFLALAVAGSTMLLGALGVADLFPPPRTAVVNRFEVFKEYLKTKDREAEVTAKRDEIRKQSKALKDSLDEIEAELRILDKSSAEFDKKTLQQIEARMELRKFQEVEFKSLMETQNAYVKEISQEISRVIQEYAEAHELGLVLDEHALIEGERGEPLLDWPIVHFCKPELKITRAILKLLNDRYKRRK